MKSAAVLTEVSNTLTSYAETDASTQGRGAIVNACKPIIHDSGVSISFVTLAVGTDRLV